MTDEWTEPIDETELDSDPGAETPDADEAPEDDASADHEPTTEEP